MQEGGRHGPSTLITFLTFLPRGIRMQRVGRRLSLLRALRPISGLIPIAIGLNECGNRSRRHSRGCADGWVSGFGPSHGRALDSDQLFTAFASPLMW